MSTPYHHALSSAKKFGGHWEDYIELHSWLDGSKAHHGDFRHLALRHHTLGIFEAEKIFGVVMTVGEYTENKRAILTRLVAEQHVIEACGYLPSVSDWLKHLQPQAWMNRPRKLSKEFGFLTQMCARFSPSRSAAPWEEAADVLVPANQR